MKLADYMHQNEISPQQLRAMLGLKSRSTVLRYITGERLPTTEVMAAIERMTGGAVTERDFQDPTPPRCMRLVIDRLGQPHWIHPWTAIEQHRLPRAQNDNGHHRVNVLAPGYPPEKPGRLEPGEEPDRWPSRPLERAMKVLGTRVKIARRGGFLLDGKLADARRVVNAANVMLRARGKPPIPYPGAESVR